MSSRRRPDVHLIGNPAVFPFQWSITAGGQDGTDQRERLSSYCRLFFFSLLISLLSRTTATDGAGPSGTGHEDGAATAMRTGRGAGGREEEVGEGRKTGWRGTWGQLRRTS